MGPKRPVEEQPGKKLAKDRTDTDSTQKQAGEPESNVVFPDQYTERLKQVSAENIERLKAARQEALNGIERDLKALSQNDHGLDPEIVDQFVILLKTARQELAESDRLTTEQATYLQATGKRMEALVAKVKRDNKGRFDD